MTNDSTQQFYNEISEIRREDTASRAKAAYRKFEEAKAQVLLETFDEIDSSLTDDDRKRWAKESALRKMLDALASARTSIQSEFTAALV